LTTAIIVAPIRAMAQSLARAVESNDVTVVAVAIDAVEAIAHLKRTPIDVVIIDAGLADSYDAVRKIARSSAAIVVLGVEDRPDRVLPYLAAGAAGYVAREATLDELGVSVRAAIRGDMICSSALVQVLRDAAVGVRRDRPVTGCLSRRERDVMSLIDLGLSNRAIAARLSIELSTVKGHVRAILDKLGCRSRAQAIAVFSGRLVGSSA